MADNTNTPEHTEIYHAALRARIGAMHGLSTADSELFLTQTDEQTMQAHAKLLAQRLNQAPTGNIAPQEGKSLEHLIPNGVQEFVNELFSNPE